MKQTSGFRFHARVPLLALFVAWLMAGCGTVTNSPTVQPTNPPAVSTSLQLSWTPTIEWAGFYMAEARGLYAKQNLVVTIKSGGTDTQGNYIDPIAAVVSGQSDFGIISGSSILQARAAGQPVVAIATIYQRHPLALTSLVGKNITKPQDLVGKTVQVSAGSQYLVDALLATQKIDRSKVKIVERTDFSTEPLLSGEADVIDAWITNEVAALKLQGHAVNVILPTDYGIDEYPNVIFTTEQLIREQPDMIERFLRASIEGLQEALTDPNASAALAVGHDTTLNQDEQIATMHQSLPLINPPGSQPGMMTSGDWESTARILSEQGILTSTVDPTAAYTLVFLNTIYAKKP